MHVESLQEHSARTISRMHLPEESLAKAKPLLRTDIHPDGEESAQSIIQGWVLPSCLHSKVRRLPLVILIPE